MFLTMAKIFTRGNKVYSPIPITNENGKGKVKISSKIRKTI